ncbi:hypothetical protein [Levilactobacillus yiduensis]|uniref:hypothetical protein n=1 Tax=Levilactobacillus yiduensis TaxID=2953880 RepID=UPI0021575418|nr:hypothetical protein [Levilactobacillus yiduensis]
MNFPDMIIPIYHSDIESRNNKFVSGSFFQSDEDGKWCGKGMYFWDNIANAKYWKKRKESSNRDDSGVAISIARASLVCSQAELLDLTDVDVGKSLKVAGILFAKKYGITLNLHNNGNVINFVHDAMTRENLNSEREELPYPTIFSVVKMAGRYPYNTKGLIGGNDHGGNFPAATTQIRMIYAVRDESLVQRRSIIDPTKEEISNDFSF